MKFMQQPHEVEFDSQVLLNLYHLAQLTPSQPPYLSIDLVVFYSQLLAQLSPNQVIVQLCQVSINLLSLISKSTARACQVILRPILYSFRVEDLEPDFLLLLIVKILFQSPLLSSGLLMRFRIDREVEELLRELIQIENKVILECFLLVCCRSYYPLDAQLLQL